MAHDRNSLDDPARLAALKSLDLLDTAPEPGFDRLTRLARQFLHVPVSLVSLVDDQRQFFKASCGLSGWAAETRQTKLSHSFCQHVVMTGEPLIVNDARLDPLLRDNLAIPDLGVIAYLGFPIRTPDGFVLGSFCAIDNAPRSWTPAEIELMADFALLVATEIAIRWNRVGSDRALQARSDELAQTNAELTKTLTLKRAVLDGTVYSIIGTAVDGTIQTFNAGAEKMLGYKREEMIGRQTPAVIHLPEEIKARAAELTRELGYTIEPGFEVFTARAQTGSVQQSEWTYIRKDGSHLPVLLSITALRDETDVIIGYLGIAYDLTEQKQSRQVLLQLTEMLRRTGEMAKIGGWEIDLRTMQPIWSIETCHIHEVDPPVAPPLDQAINFYPPEVRPRLEAVIQAAVTNGTPWDLELPMITAKGRSIWVRAQGTVVRENGRVVKLGGALQDITQRKRAEAALQESQERFRSAFEFTGIGMAIVGLDGRWIQVNKTLCEIVGYSAAELMIKTFQDITHPDDLNVDLANVRALLDGTQRFYTMEKRYFHRDGHVVWINLTASLVHDETGKALYFVSQIEDISERKELQKKLAVARDQALASSRLKSEFLANMSHEIRTPMNGVIGMTDLLLETRLTVDQREMASVIQRSGEGLLTIINDILDFSKIEAGKMRIEPVEFGLQPLIDEVILLLTPRAQEKNLPLTCEFDARLGGPLLGDGGRIRQVLVNLVGNAIKFTAKGSVGVSARCLEEDPGHRVLRIEIKDTGIGIPAAVQSQLFQSFVQADGSTTRQFGGTGLGLAISRQLIELMGGQIGLISEEGRGSTFWFQLKLPRPAVQPVPMRPAAPCVVLPAVTVRKTIRILVAEDNPTNQLVAQRFLEKMNYPADFASDGPEALAMLAKKEYDAVLMDCQMPGMDGYTVTRHIRAGEAFGLDPAIPIIALTAYAQASDRQKCLDAGMNDYLTKPLRAEDLRNALARCGLVAPLPAGEKSSAAHAGQAEVLLADQINQLRDLPGRKHPTLLEDVIEIFLKETPPTLALLRDLVGRKEQKELAMLAHRLAGSSANLGGQSMRTAARALEEAAGQGHWADIPERLTALEHEWQRLASALRQLQTPAIP